uniref:Uncharacterized protein n=1 Tax=Rhizophora mucronata TaxID=61149 RepID=A0A2P2PVX4_RHIMU
MATYFSFRNSKFYSLNYLPHPQQPCGK